MKFDLRSKIFLLLLDIIVICFCAAGIYSIYLKADLPFDLKIINSNLFIEKLSVEDSGFSEGQKVLSVDGYNFNDWEEVELHLDGKQIGDRANITIYENGNEKVLQATLTSYYTLLDLSIISIVGLIFIVFSILVRVKAPENSSAKLFHLAGMGLAMVITMTAGNFTIEPFRVGYILRILWLAAYSVTPVLFIHFALTFLDRYKGRSRWILALFYSLASVNIILLSYFFFEAVQGKNINGITNYVFYYDTFFRAFQVTCIIVAISVCIYAYKLASNLEERKRLQWLLFGFFIGPVTSTSCR